MLDSSEKTTLDGNVVKENVKNIFIVHGTDHEPMKELKALLIDLGLNPVILHEQASGGSYTLPEKLDKHAGKIGYVFVILSPDDFGGPAGQLEQALSYEVPFDIAMSARKVVQASYRKRARQNVILEFGYFVGKLGRSRVCCLYKGNVELPSDMHGICYVHFRHSVHEARDIIIKELKAAGYKKISEQSEIEKGNIEDSKNLKKEVEKLKDYLDRRVD